ncbi:MAG: TetR/AcrR family transcriptional regulator [Lachnospiraceae bacterium]|nr:TetR/AcrR family transcriptional regulator [Lachnospiraceae bacterium]
MKNRNKRDLILDAMQELMSTSSVQTISVSDIAQKAGIGKGSIYYYFNSKNDMIEAVIERSYSRVLDEGQALVDSQDMGAFEKMEIIYRACLDSSLELKRQEALNTFNEQQQSALIHQKFVGIIITRLEPILTDIIRQGIAEGKIRCEFPEETARIILTILTVTLDNSLAPISQEKITKVLAGFAWMLEESQDIPENTLQFLLGKKLDRS